MILTKVRISFSHLIDMSAQCNFSSNGPYKNMFLALNHFGKIETSPFPPFQRVHMRYYCLKRFISTEILKIKTMKLNFEDYESERLQNPRL